MTMLIALALCLVLHPCESLWTTPLSENLNSTWENTTKSLYVSHISVGELGGMDIADMAGFIADMINRRTDILPGYRLVFTHRVVPQVSEKTKSRKLWAR